VTTLLSVSARRGGIFERTKRCAPAGVILKLVVRFLLLAGGAFGQEKKITVQMLYSNDGESDAVEQAVAAKINLSSRYAVRDNDTANL